jgi:hypothetical protein
VRQIFELPTIAQLAGWILNKVAELLEGEEIAVETPILEDSLEIQQAACSSRAYT